MNVLNDYDRRVLLSLTTAITSMSVQSRGSSGCLSQRIFVFLACELFNSMSFSFISVMKRKGSELRATCISESWHRISFETCCCTMQVICTWKGRKTRQTRMTRCERLLVSSTTSFSATKTRPSTAWWLLAILNITRWSSRGTSRCRIGEISCKLGRCEHISGLWSCVYGNYGEPPWVESIKDFLASSLCHTQTVLNILV